MTDQDYTPLLHKHVKVTAAPNVILTGELLEAHDDGGLVLRLPGGGLVKVASRPLAVEEVPYG